MDFKHYTECKEKKPWPGVFCPVLPSEFTAPKLISKQTVKAEESRKHG